MFVVIAIIDRSHQHPNVQVVVVFGTQVQAKLCDLILASLCACHTSTMSNASSTNATMCPSSTHSKVSDATLSFDDCGLRTCVACFARVNGACSHHDSCRPRDVSGDYFSDEVHVTQYFSSVVQELLLQRTVVHLGDLRRSYRAFCRLVLEHAASDLYLFASASEIITAWRSCVVSTGKWREWHFRQALGTIFPVQPCRHLLGDRDVRSTGSENNDDAQMCSYLNCIMANMANPDVANLEDVDDVLFGEDMTIAYSQLNAEMPGRKVVAVADLLDAARKRSQLSFYLDFAANMVRSNPDVAVGDLLEDVGSVDAEMRAAAEHASMRACSDVLQVPKGIPRATPNDRDERQTRSAYVTATKDEGVKRTADAPTFLPHSKVQRSERPRKIRRLLFNVQQRQPLAGDGAAQLPSLLGASDGAVDFSFVAQQAPANNMSYFDRKQFTLCRGQCACNGAMHHAKADAVRRPKPIKRATSVQTPLSF